MRMEVDVGKEEEEKAISVHAEVKRRFHAFYTHTKVCNYSHAHYINKRN